MRNGDSNILAPVAIKNDADAPELIRELEISGYRAKIERAVFLHVEAFDWNHYTALHDGRNTSD